MSAPDFYFAVNAIFRHLNDRHGKAALVRYWRDLSTEYYARRWNQWLGGGAEAIAQDWRDYFSQEPRARVEVRVVGDSVDLEIEQCPAIKHLMDNAREIVPYFCEHCDHVCGAMAARAGFAFERTGGNGSCHQRFVQLTTSQHPIVTAAENP